MIGTIKIVLHGGDQLIYLAKSEAAGTVVNEIAKSTLQHLQPGPLGRDEVQMEPRIPPKTGIYEKDLCIP